MSSVLLLRTARDVAFGLLFFIKNSPLRHRRESDLVKSTTGGPEEADTRSQATETRPECRICLMVRRKGSVRPRAVRRAPRPLLTPTPRCNRRKRTRGSCARRANAWAACRWGKLAMVAQRPTRAGTVTPESPGCRPAQFVHPTCIERWCAESGATSCELCKVRTAHEGRPPETRPRRLLSPVPALRRGPVARHRLAPLALPIARPSIPLLSSPPAPTPGSPRRAGSPPPPLYAAPVQW